MIPNSSETIETDSLLSYLYGPNYDFPYQLILKHEMPLPLYRERNYQKPTTRSEAPIHSKKIFSISDFHG